MNQDQVTGLLRILVPIVCTWLAAQGYSAFGDSGLTAQITAVVTGAAAVIWTIKAHTDASKLAAAAKVDPQILITVPPAVAAAKPAVAALVADSSVPNVTAPPPPPTVRKG